MSGRTQDFYVSHVNDQVNNGAAYVVTPVLIAEFRPYFTFSVRAEQILRMDIETSNDGGITWRVPHTLTLAIAGSVYTCYELPDPRNKTGFIVIAATQMRVRLTNNSGFDSLFEWYSSLTNFGG